MAEKTHWKVLHNPDYLGSYSLAPGKDMILTIKNVSKKNVKGPDGKDEECMVMLFVENVKPMIINATNAKIIEKLYKTPYIEEWTGRKIQIYSEKVRAFGDTVDALRIRNTIPKVASNEPIPTVCADCKNPIQPFEKMSAEQVAQYTYRQYSKYICTECASKIKEATKVEDPL